MRLHELARSIEAVDRGQIAMAQDILMGATRIFFIGNGGSAAIASHMAVDWSKAKHIPTAAFSDASLLTCLSNDYGYEQVFAKALALFPISASDVLVAISSSGQSINILNGVNMAKGRKAKVVTLSGFRPDNPLRSTGAVNFYVPSESYGVVEVTHLAIIHSMVGI